MRINGSATSSTTTEFASPFSNGDVRPVNATAASRTPFRVADRAAGVVRVEAPGRLHLGFLDPSATLGRCFGSAGLAIDGMATIVEACFDQAEGVVAEDEAGRRAVGRVRRRVGMARRLWDD